MKTRTINGKKVNPSILRSIANRTGSDVLNPVTARQWILYASNALEEAEKEIDALMTLLIGAKP